MRFRPESNRFSGVCAGMLGRSMPRLSALRTLCRSARGAGPSTELLIEEFGKRPVAPRDRDLARELVQGTWRLRGSLDCVLATCSQRPLADLDAAVLWALRLGAYQALALDRVPPRAAVHTTVEALKRTRSKHATGFVNAVLRRTSELRLEVEDEAEHPEEPCCRLPRGDGQCTVLSRDVFPPAADGQAAHLAARWSHPEWFVERLLEAYSLDQTIQVLKAGLARPYLSLRPSPESRDALVAALTEAEIAFETEEPCLVLPSAGRVEDLPGFEQGWFNVQGPTAASVVPALDLQPGEGVLDLCAAPGGKTLAIAAAVGSKGIVLAVDSSDERLERLRATVAQRGLAQVAVVIADATDPSSLPSGLASRGQPGFDAVLVDVPCSNSGVFGRRVEARWRLKSLDRVTMLAEQGAHLLMVAADKVRRGGRVVFSTCSIDRIENQDVVASFLAEDNEFRLVKEQLTLPVLGRRDGGYHAVLRRKGK